MIEGALFDRVGLPPHIDAKDSLAKRHWGQLAALAPVFMAACFTGHAEILRVLLICLVSALAFDFLAAKIFRKKENLRSGETVLAAALFSLLLPSKCPAEVVILGIFMAVFVAREFFGGTGAYPLHPLFLARAFLQICFPRTLSEPMLLVGDGNVWMLVGMGLGGILLLKQKQGYWETPVLFMATCFSCEVLFGGKEMTLVFFSSVLLTGFFLLADPVTLPLTRKGTLLFVLGAAFLGSWLDPNGFSIRSMSYAILGMGLLTPWLDVWFKPVSYRAKQHLKATYPA
ncbi:MAG: RnfABCDGE type electron transport complex subunit D [Candidatus Omnitrophota bacterium]